MASDYEAEEYHPGHWLTPEELQSLEDAILDDMD